MFNFNPELAFLYGIFIFSLLSIFLTAWVVWHVEKKLDISYKFFLLAVSIFTVEVFFEILQFYQAVSAWVWPKIFKALFIIFFTIAVFEMRDLIMDYKNKPNQEPTPPQTKPVKPLSKSAKTPGKATRLNKKK